VIGQGEAGGGENRTSSFNVGPRSGYRMEGLGRFRGLAAVVTVFALGATVFGRPLLLAGAAVLGGFLLATQYEFVRTLVTVDGAIDVDQSVTPRRVATDEPVRATLTVRLAEPIGDSLECRLEPPVGVRVRDTGRLSAALDPGEVEATTTARVEAPIAGAHTFDAPTVTVTDAGGRFRERIRRGSAVELFAQPPVPRNVHIGQGGETFAIRIGDHTSGQRGEGLEPAELRRYQPGDAARRIDWKATARLDEPYVREFEQETDRTFAFVLDRRASMGEGPPGRTKFAFAREVALGILDTAREAADPVGLYVVDDEGLRDADPPAATQDHYERVRARIGEAEAGDRSDGAGRVVSPVAVRRKAELLAGEGSAFGQRLRPYFDVGGTHVERVAEEPFFRTANAHVQRLEGSVRTVLITDDERPAEVLEAAKIARGQANRVLVFLLPGVLFEEGALTNLDAAYDRYREFEEFRRRVNRLERVRAFEVGPGDRLGAIIGSDAERRRSA